MFRHLLLALLLTTAPAAAHHGGASISQGPGTPIETNSPLNIPEGTTIAWTRFEHVDFQKFAFAAPNTTSFDFLQLGLSHGVTDAFTLTAILPYNLKTQEDFGTYRGVGDVKLLGNLGFHHDPDTGFALNTAQDTGISLEETDHTYFSVFGGFSMPTGNSYVDLGNGADPGLQPGFGSPTFMIGGAATRSLAPGFGLAGDTSYEIFTPRRGVKFGNEFRVNVAGVYELYGDEEATVSRLDGVLELNFLNLERDVTDGVPEIATGGRILYLSPGLRMQVGDVNVGMLLKFPVAKSLNEASLQQGSEGLENYRAIFTLSYFL